MSFMTVACSSASAEWPTPEGLFGELAAEFGPFDLDPAATRGNAKCQRFYTAADNGLLQPWAGRVWLNPPYGQTITAWMVKALQSALEGALVVCLVPARPDTRWWRETAAEAALVRFLPGRVRFGRDPAPFPSAVVVLGKLPGRHGSRAHFCAGCGRAWFPARSNAKTCSDRCRQSVARSQITGLKRDGRAAVRVSS